jgi:hypothetical protein
MKGDFSRITFKAEKRFSQVLLQQGRVLLDADFNEQGAISVHALRCLIRDLLGPHAGPKEDLGFLIGDANGRITIGLGHYYVDGVLAVNVGPPPDETNKATPLFYDAQPGYPFFGSIEAKDFKVGSKYFFYLDVWERAVSWLEDDSIREVALGGPETATRAQVAWRVMAVILPVGGAFVPEVWLDQNVQRHSRLDPGKGGAMLPQLKAWTDPQDNPDETPCVADPLGGYQGLENQLYRVEIHAAPAGGTVTFKWSRDNGSVVAAWEGTDGNDLIVAGVYDRAHGFSAGQWVELTDEIGQLKSEPGVMVRLVKVERGRLTFDPASAAEAIPLVEKLIHPIVRRWDHVVSKDYTMSGGAIELQPGVTYALERGIKISFFKQDGAIQYRTGDYWLIPARTATGDIEWPYHLGDVDGQLQRVYDYSDPNGVYHAYAPLAEVEPKSPTSVTVKSLQRVINQLWSPA